MTNNTNVNLAGKLFAYVQHGVDINANIKEKYNSSLIFIGDEQQIYVPAKNTYVGVGMSNFNSALTQIANLQTELNELKNTTRSSIVQKIYPQWGPKDYMNGNTKLVPVENANQLGYLTGSVEITAIGDYDVTTGFAYTQYQYPTEDGEFGVQTGEGINWHAANTNATSGIRISYQSTFRLATDEATGMTFREPDVQRLIIDDTQTWTYMTSAYSYTLNFSRDYTNLQVETLYHDLLGIGEEILVPVSNTAIWVHNPATDQDEFVGGTFYEWDDNSTPVMPISMKSGDPAAFNENPATWTFPAGTDGSHWQKIDKNNLSDLDSTKEHFKVSTDYNNTYNMNIANGIQTLKEVAYILDQLSDGGIGTTTYLTRAEWEALSGLEKTQDTLNTYTATGSLYSYYRVYTNGRPSTNATTYGYYINTGNPENLGIQIAYSIAGNKADIEDLHSHVTYIEEGKNSLRSLAASSTNMITVSAITTYTGFETTDTGQSLPAHEQATTYNVGDLRLVFGLELASTYVTTTYTSTNAAATTYTKFGERYYDGVYQPVNMTDVAGKPVAQNQYYKIENNEFVAVEAGTADPIDQILYKGTQWYTKTNSIRKDYANDTFEVLTDVEYANLDPATIVYTYDSTNQVFVNAGAASTHTWVTGTYYIKTSVDAPETVLHAVDYKETTENRIATTAWTAALIDDKNKNLQESMQNIKKLAYMYTDAKIDALDWTMGYEDFDWDKAIEMQMTHTYSAAQKAALTVGSDAYNKAFEYSRNEWLTYIRNINSGQTAEDQDRFTTSYIVNKIRSQYISNIVEENGVIKVTGTKELPTDMVEIHTEVWGNQDSSTAKTFTYIDLSSVAIPENDPNSLVEGSNFEKLFYALNDVPYHQLYYKPEGETDVTYEKVTGSITEANPYYVYDAATGEYVEATNNNKIAWNRKQSNANLNSPYYTQLYTKVAAYYEVDLSTIEQVYTESNGVVSYTGEIKSFEYGKFDAATGKYAEANPVDITKLYIANKVGAATSKYITGSIQHYSYTSVGGEGQNKLSLTTHITYLEDATPNNTGLADAYDVVSFMDNLFEWVDLSATIDVDAINTRSIFYKKYEFTETPQAQVVDGTKVTGITLYKAPATPGGNYTAVGANDAVYWVFGKKADASGDIVEYSSDSNVMIPGSQYYSFYELDGSTKRPINLYIRTQEAFTNVLNLQITEYGK